MLAELQKKNAGGIRVAAKESIVCLEMEERADRIAAVTALGRPLTSLHLTVKTDC
jgi:hypothetical protein